MGEPAPAGAVFCKAISRYPFTPRVKDRRRSAPPARRGPVCRSGTARAGGVGGVAAVLQCSRTDVRSALTPAAPAPPGGLRLGIDWAVNAYVSRESPHGEQLVKRLSGRSACQLG